MAPSGRSEREGFHAAKGLQSWKAKTDGFMWKGGPVPSNSSSLLPLVGSFGDRGFDTSLGRTTDGITAVSVRMELVGLDC